MFDIVQNTNLVFRNFNRTELFLCILLFGKIWNNCILCYSFFSKKYFFCDSSFVKRRNVERFQLLLNYINFPIFPQSASITAIHNNMFVNLTQIWWIILVPLLHSYKGSSSEIFLFLHLETTQLICCADNSLVSVWS